MKEETFPDPEKCLHQQGDQLGQRGSFRGSEESAAASLQQNTDRPAQRVPATLLHSPGQDWCVLVHVGAGC